MRSLVLLSGGVDSAVALAITGAKLALSFDYGQTHRRELSAARAIAKHYGVEHHQLDIHSVLDIPGPLTGQGEIPDTHASTTVVPGRNLILLAIATGWAQQWGYGAVVIGANADDNAGYPDCRPAFIDTVDAATQQAYGVTVWAPLLKMTKAEIIATGRECQVPLDLTYSCYRGGVVQCGRCGACHSNTV